MGMVTLGTILHCSLKILLDDLLRTVSFESSKFEILDLSNNSITDIRSLKLLWRRSSTGMGRTEFIKDYFISEQITTSKPTDKCID